MQELYENVSLKSLPFVLVLGVSRQRKKASRRYPSKNLRAPVGLSLVRRSFSSKRISRQYPWLVGLHKFADGALLGVLVTVALMSGFTLYWQHLWTEAFYKLEMTRDLKHRLTESTAMLEKHLLDDPDIPLSMVPTTAADLIYLNKSEIDDFLLEESSLDATFSEEIRDPLVHQSY